MDRSYPWTLSSLVNPALFLFSIPGHSSIAPTLASRTSPTTLQGCGSRGTSKSRKKDLIMEVLLGPRVCKSWRKLRQLSCEWLSAVVSSTLSSQHPHVEVRRSWWADVLRLADCTIPKQPRRRRREEEEEDGKEEDHVLPKHVPR